MMPEDAVTIEGATTRFDKPADSGNMVSRHFCGNCGAQALRIAPIARQANIRRPDMGASLQGVKSGDR